MKLLIHTRVPEGYLLRVHLDEAKKIRRGDPRVADGLRPGDPDPDWVAEWTWGSQAPQTPADPGFKGPAEKAPMRPMSDEEYRAMQVAEVKLLAEDELARRRGAMPSAEPEVFAQDQEL